MSIPPFLAAEHLAGERMDALLPELVRVRQRIAAEQAREAELLSQASDVAADWADVSAPASSDAEMAYRSIAAEIGTAWRVSDRTVQRQMNTATTLTERFPATHTALREGQISLAHVQVILEIGIRLAGADDRAEYETEVLAVAKTESAARTRPVAVETAEALLREPLAERHTRARKTRCVSVTPGEDGMAELCAVLPAALAYGAFDRIDQIAHATADAAQSRGARATSNASITVGHTSAEHTPPIAGVHALPDPARRTIGELRADVLADLLLSSDTAAHLHNPTGLGAIQARVALTVPALSLTDPSGTADETGSARPAGLHGSVLLDGQHPIDPETARQLTAHAPGWDRVLTHPATGAVLTVDRYRPTTQQRRLLAVRDQHCRFPGCRIPLTACDIDHTTDYQYGGATSIQNLAHLCRRHHSLKHHSPWQVVQQPDGVLRWTSPTGKTYADKPLYSTTFTPELSGPPEAPGKTNRTRPSPQQNHPSPGTSAPHGRPTYPAMTTEPLATPARDARELIPF